MRGLAALSLCQEALWGEFSVVLNKLDMAEVRSYFQLFDREVLLDEILSQLD